MQERPPPRIRLELNRSRARGYLQRAARSGAGAVRDGELLSKDEVERQRPHVAAVEVVVREVVQHDDYLIEANVLTPRRNTTNHR